MTETDAGAIKNLWRAVARLETDVKHRKIEIHYLRADFDRLLADIEQLKAATPKEQFAAFKAIEEKAKDSLKVSNG